MRVIFGLLALGAMATTATAEPRSWTGCYGGAAIGYSAAVTDTTLTGDIENTSPDPFINFNGLGSQGVTGTAIVGCDLQIKRFVLGAWGDYAWDDLETTIDVALTPLPIAGTLGKSSIDNHWSAGGRLGFLVTPEIMIYGLAGYSQASMGDLSSPIFGPGAKMAGPDLTGWVAGAGSEISLGNGFYLQSQYSYTSYESKEVTLVDGINIPGPNDLDLNLKMDTDIHQARVGLTYKFGGRDDAVVPLK